MEHTKGPWHSEECRTEDYAILSTNGAIVVPCLDDFGHIGAVKEANARRIVACVNACEGLSTELLENVLMLGDTLKDRFDDLKFELTEYMDRYE